jgi:precorrin-6B methylase 2
MLPRRLFLASMFLLPSLAADEPSAIAERDVDRGTPRRYVFRKEHDPNGTGKFYLGREIAQVMSFHGAAWLNRPEREEEERLSKLIQLLDLKPGSIAADIGAGSGVLTEQLARAVAPGGKVFAVDIQDEMLALLRERMKAESIDNVETVLGTITSPKLEPNSVDLMLLVDVYHEFSHPYEMTQTMAEALKPGGRIVFVEYRKEDPRVPIKEVHKMSEAQVKKELLQPEFGLEWVETHDELPRQHVVVFQKKAANGK